MADTLCGICNSTPKKYKCPTCALPYCSLLCYKEHKVTHSDPAPIAPISAPVPNLPNPPPPAPLPKYLRSKTDFATLATSPKFQHLLTAHPALLPRLQRIYAATIEPDPDDERGGGGSKGRGGIRGRGWAGRGRSRGGGRGGPGEQRKWTQKKGDSDGLRALKGIREGKLGEEEEAGIAEFVKLVGDMFREGKEKEDLGSAEDAMNT